MNQGMVMNRDKMAKLKMRLFLKCCLTCYLFLLFHHENVKFFYVL